MKYFYFRDGHYYANRGHFNRLWDYPASVDYDTNSVGFYQDLAKVNYYLHILDHIFLEQQEIIQDILDRLTDLENNTKDAIKYAHVPSKYVKADETHDYILALNKNRTAADGLPEDWEDKHQQLHVMDTSKLDSIIDNITKNVGIETEIHGEFDPAEDTCTKLGNTGKYQEIKIYWSSLIFSIPRTFTIMAKNIGGKSSFVFSNITDDPTGPEVVHGEIGQTLCELKGTEANSELCFYNSQLFRFENSIGTGENNSWNRITADGNNMQSGGSTNFSTSNWKDGTNPNYGKGWLHILKITGVNYGTNAAEKDLEAAVLRANASDYIGFDDYYRNLRYAMAAKLPRQQLALLGRLEAYKKELSNLAIYDMEMKESKSTMYDYLIDYRNKFERSIDNE